MSDIKIETEFKNLLPPLTEEQKTELEKTLPENMVLIDKFRKPKETHIFGITDFNNLTEGQFDQCLRHCKRYQDAICKVAMLYTDEDSLTAWNCMLENQKEIDLELETIDTALKNLMQIQNYFKGVKKK